MVSRFGANPFYLTNGVPASCETVRRWSLRRRAAWSPGRPQEPRRGRAGEGSIQTLRFAAAALWRALRSSPGFAKRRTRDGHGRTPGVVEGRRRRAMTDELHPAP